jgi:hypothetical protein
MIVASRACRLLLGLGATVLLQIPVAQAGQVGHDAKPTVAPAKPMVAPPRLSKADVTKPSRPAPGTAKAPEHPPTSGPAKPAEARPAKAGAVYEHGDAPTRVEQRIVTPGRRGLKSAERAVVALGAALSARRDRLARQEAAVPLPPPPPAPVRRLAARRRAAPAVPAPPPARYDVPWPTRIVEVHWPREAEHRAVSWPSDRPAPIELRWDLKALQSDLSEPTAAVDR